MARVIPLTIPIAQDRHNAYPLGQGDATSFSQGRSYHRSGRLAMASQELRSLRWQIVRVVRRAAARVVQVVGRRAVKVVDKAAVRVVPVAGKVARGAEAKREGKAVREMAIKVVAEVVRVPAADKRVAKAGKGVDRAVVVRVVPEAVKVLVAGRRAGKVADRAARVVAKASPGAVRRVVRVGAASRAR